MTQSELQKKHDETIALISYYASGLITLPEFVNAISRDSLQCVDGLIDPATGLRM